MIELREASVVVPAPEGDAMILHPTSLVLAERRISIIGGNGSGKSTLARLCNGLIEPTTGSVLVAAGADPVPGVRAERSRLDTARDGAAVRRLVGFVFTDASAQLIMPTVAEDLMLSLRRLHPKRAERRAAAEAALARFGLEHLAERSVHTLSGGQKQLLAIATVLATDPAVLVADEPTTLLDLRNARSVGELLMSLPQQVILVTHDLDLAARAERTLVVADGRVVFDGEPDAAVSHYRELVRA
ncbi:ABC transporter ATP-binding protein [Leucobacter weissii]|uniref:ABC transporter ATP-binding protein n=1 Tax=Leucobacter weissii TaxID=1983706 RepID=A0A939MIB1_9MICO|nr:ABC transporter ATP-binding protein [Leucobacter weissii]MBO1901458.1 ABC transporter ATP-binding protein [Leucobacter weissii]